MIKQNNIKSTNVLDSYKFTVGNSYDDVDPVYHVPLRLALYIMKDKDDKIQFDVPVEGNIHDPAVFLFQNNIQNHCKSYGQACYFSIPFFG